MLCSACGIGAPAEQSADPPAAAQTGAAASSSAGDSQTSLSQGGFFSSIKQALKKGFDNEVVRGHFDQGVPPNAHRYYCLVDPKTGKRESNGVLGQPAPLADGMTGIKVDSVSLYSCDKAEQQGLLVTEGYVLSAAARRAGTGGPVAPVSRTPSASQVQTPAAAMTPGRADAAGVNPRLPPAATAAGVENLIAPIHQFIDGFNSGNVTSAYAAYAPGDITIVDEFAPHRWAGPNAPQTWAADYDKHARATGVSDGWVKYGEPTRAEVEGDVAYIIIPTVYQYKEHGQATLEEGQMTFVLHRAAGLWKIQSWTWTGVPPHPAK